MKLRVNYGLYDIVVTSSVSTRLLASVWWFFTLIIVSSYTANLAACLTVEQNEEVFRNVEELANQRTNGPTFVKYGAKAGGATEGFFKVSTLLFFKEDYSMCFGLAN